MGPRRDYTILGLAYIIPHTIVFFNRRYYRPRVLEDDSLCHEGITLEFLACFDVICISSSSMLLAQSLIKRRKRDWSLLGWLQALLK